MSRWLRETVGLAFNEVRWSVSTYTRYLETMAGWAGELALAADEVEVCIFSAQAPARGHPMGFQLITQRGELQRPSPG